MKKEELVRRLHAFNETVALIRGKQKFVGAMYDSTSHDELGVALVIGINYGQEHSSKDSSGRSEEEVGYAHRVQQLNPKREPLQVVLWNFYPYLTSSEWMSETKNAADQAKRIFEDGYDDPFVAFEHVVEITQPELIVFHGVTSAVPVLARIALQRVGRQGILVSNLARGFLPRTKTSIPETRNNRLFVYGTLAPGQPNAHELADLHGTWQPATVRGVLHAEGWGAALGYPALEPDERAGEVQGQVFTSADLPQHWARLDAFEGSGYVRALVSAVLRDGIRVEAFVYALNRDAVD